MGYVRKVNRRQNSAFKININFGYILRHRKTREVHYFKPFEQEGMFERPIYIASRKDLKKLGRKIKNMNIMDSLLQQRTDTKWVVELLTSVRFTVYKTSYLLGCSSDLDPVPDFVKKNKALYALATDKRTRQLFRDNLCAFLWLALEQGYDLRHLEGECHCGWHWSRAMILDTWKARARKTLKCGLKPEISKCLLRV